MSILFHPFAPVGQTKTRYVWFSWCSGLQSNFSMCGKSQNFHFSCFANGHIFSFKQIIFQVWLLASVWVGKTEIMYWKFLLSIMYYVLITFPSKVIFRVVRQAGFTVHGWLVKQSVVIGFSVEKLQLAGALNLSYYCFLGFTVTLCSNHESVLSHAGNCLTTIPLWKLKKLKHLQLVDF